MKRKTTITRTLTFALIFLVSCFAFSQEKCGMVAYMEEQMQDPEFAKEHKKNQAKYKAEIDNMLRNGDVSYRGASIVVPVAVHFPTGNEADRACLEALAQNQIDILNADYSATNTDISQWQTVMSNYPGLTPGASSISFCMAVANHPVGFDPQLLEGNPAVTIGEEFGGGSNTDATWSGYMNFVIRDIGGLGFSPLGGSIAAGQAVTMDVNAFGSGAGCAGSGIVPDPGGQYDLGRTVTHELGHFYNLRHTFNGDGPNGDPNAVCGSGTGDGIADTPEVASSTYGCPGVIPDGCAPATKALIMNYMDYGDDRCLYMFTPQQMTIVNTYVGNVLQPQFKPNVCVAPDPGFIIAANDSPVFSCPTTDNQAVFNLSYATILGFSESTMFTAVGNPPGSTVVFSPTSMSADGNFTMAVNNLSGTTLGDYIITVTGTSGTTSVTETVDVLLKNNCTSIQCIDYASAQNLGLAIPDGTGTTTPVNGPPVTHTINVPDNGAIESLTVNIDVSHTYVGDLLVRITHPDGTTFANVWAGNCGSTDDFDITFDDNGSAIVCTTDTNPTTGTFIPEEALSIFNGLDAAGDWEILIADFFAGDTGTLNDWSLNICSEQALSIEDNEFNNFAIFPNPNSGTFTIKLNSNSGNDIKVDVHDVSGRRIFKNSYSVSSEFEQTINLNNVQSGMYLVTVNDGNRKVTKRIVVE
ncbi:zinc-dependent metalloprotease [Ichthyenterobacterium magnum]|uniref:Putative secreted protein (Por secretion system target) n=1 Tax=Ichthyenterobacterium magnum TaxID=1230530 RepID=A0A420DWJ9_9FLAO|nr:T9SS type A sorting domain-containing protein [Ichthyenterobacterium magnum]RKE98612.1 putative secreted protein (Por secretion system target) [Ichthyenterobacterium magnum]